MQTLIESPKNIQEIIKDTGSHFPTTKQFLDELMLENMVVEYCNIGNKKYFKRSDDPVFNGIPLSRKQRIATLAILKEVVEEYKRQQNSDNFPLRTVIQKIVVRYIEENNVDLPVLNYKYGKVCMLTYDENIYQEYNPKIKLTSKEKENISHIVKEMLKMNSNQAKIFQYKNSEDMEFYLTKEKILDLLSSPLMGDEKNAEENRDLFYSYLVDWELEYPEELIEARDIFDKFIYYAMNILRLKRTGEEAGENTKSLVIAFETLWDAVTMNYFFESAEKFIKEEDKKQLFNQMRLSRLSPINFNAKLHMKDMEDEVNFISDKDAVFIKTDNKTKELLNLLLGD